MTPSFFQHDSALTAYARVLAQIQDPTAVAALADFVEQNLNGDVLWCTHAATHALKILTAQTDLNERTFDYFPEEMLDTVERARTWLQKHRHIPPPALPARPGRNQQRPSCFALYVVTDAAGNPLTWVNPKTGATETLKLKLQRYQDSYLIPPTDEGERIQEQVENGDGVFVEGDLGKASRWANCGGYAVNHWFGVAGAMSPAALFERLAGAQIIEGPLARGEAIGGDLVFWQNNRTNHVAVIHQVEPSSVGSDPTITTIQKDGWTGVFQADIDADYFNTQRQFGTPVIYRWAKAGLRVKRDSSVSGNPNYCQNVSVIIR